MTPKEFDFFVDLIEKTAKAAYEHGHADGRADKPLNTEQFYISRGHRLVLKKELNSFVKRR